MQRELTLSGLPLTSAPPSTLNRVCTKLSASKRPTPIRRTLTEDAEDLAAFERRAKEPALSFEEVLKDMKRRGKL